MNVPKGNAVALQALKPIENKTADILSGYVFELIKHNQTEYLRFYFLLAFNACKATAFPLGTFIN